MIKLLNNIIIIINYLLFKTLLHPTPMKWV